MINRMANACFSGLTAFALALGATSAPAFAASDSFITLGTEGGPVSNPLRSQPANVLLDDGNAYLIDVGDGAVQRLAAAQILLGQVRAVFVSHLHFDHTAGLAALLGLRYQTDVPGRLTIYGPPGTKEMVDGLIASMQPESRSGYGLPGQKTKAPGDLIQVVEIRDGADIHLDTVRLRAVRNTHYSFTAGSPEAEEFQSLSFRFDLTDRSIVYTGDTGPSSALEGLAKGADLLVSEIIDVDATVANVRRNNPSLTGPAFDGLVQHLVRHHLTPEQVGELASAAGVKVVVLTHQVPGSSDPADLVRYKAGVNKHFNGHVFVANDLDSF